ncbi:MAG: hypothetical protein R3B72_14785 [Polyangiaceae bacterium]
MRRVPFAPLLVLAIAAPGLGGCVNKVVMAELEGDDGVQPHTVILYTGVRDTTRRYADYSVVGEEILEE